MASGTVASTAPGCTTASARSAARATRPDRAHARKAARIVAPGRRLRGDPRGDDWHLASRDRD